MTSEIANAYYINRWGTAFNGAVTSEYTDPISGQVAEVRFDRATEKPVRCSIEVRVAQSQNSVEDVTQAILDYANGLVEGETGFSLGLDASPFEVASAVNLQLPNVFVKRCQLGLVGGPLSTDTIENEIFEKATIVRGDIAVIIVT